MYVAVKGGETAIAHSLDLIADKRRGDRDVAELSLEQIDQQLGLAVDRVMTEGSCYDRALAALAIKQARGDLVEAIFLLRAYRTTLPRFGDSVPLDTTSMVVERRISGTFKDIPGGQVLGPTYDYTHRLLDFSLAASGERPHAPTAPIDSAHTLPRVGDILERDGLLEPPPKGPPQGEKSDDLTRQPLTLPASRPLRLQNLARGDEGFLLALGYSTQRGYGNNHPFVGEIRFGGVPVCFVPEELGFAVEIADIDVTECDMVNQFAGSHDVPPQFTRGYGLAFGHVIGHLHHAIEITALGIPPDVQQAHQSRMRARHRLEFLQPAEFALIRPLALERSPIHHLHRPKRPHHIATQPHFSVAPATDTS